MACAKCSATDNLSVWVVPDPYYGYGHYPQLACESCKPDSQIKKSHIYDPEQDNYFLGLSDKPGPAWQWTAKYTQICWDCGDLISTEKTGYGYGITGASIAFCQSCYYKKESTPVKFENLNEKELQTKRETRYNKLVDKIWAMRCEIMRHLKKSHTKETWLSDFERVWPEYIKDRYLKEITESGYEIILNFTTQLEYCICLGNDPEKCTNERHYCVCMKTNPKRCRNVKHICSCGKFSPKECRAVKSKHLCH